MYRDCTPVLDRPAHERFDALADALPSSLLVPRLITADVAAAEDFYADALARGHEGVMVKALDAPCYRHDKRAEEADTIETVRALHAAQLARGMR